MEIGGIFHIPGLDNWQGSYSTGPGYLDVRKKKKEDEEKPEEQPANEGITHDDSGVVHVDIKA